MGVPKIFWAFVFPQKLIYLRIELIYYIIITYTDASLQYNHPSHPHNETHNLPEIEISDFERENASSICNTSSLKATDFCFNSCGGGSSLMGTTCDFLEAFILFFIPCSKPFLFFFLFLRTCSTCIFAVFPILVRFLYVFHSLD